jgi:hypothetical protein
MRESKRAAGTLEDMSEEQMYTVQRLKEDFKASSTEFPDLFTTWSLLRFCRARDFSFEKVKVMIENFLNFRRRVNYDLVRQLKTDEFKLITDNYARGYAGYDYQGRLVMIEKVSQSNIPNIVLNVSEDQMTHYFVNLYERLIHVVFPILSQVHQKRVDRTVLIIDLGNINLLKLFDSNLKTFLKFSSKMSQDYYPELLGQSFILNAPWVFKGIWSIVKIWLDKKTTDKFVIESGSGRDKICECMNLKMLPTYLGGEQDGLLTDFNGPWKKDLLDSWSRNSFYLKDRSPEYTYFYTEDERRMLIGRNKSREELRVLIDDQNMKDEDSVMQPVKISSFKVTKLRRSLLM